MDGWAGQWYVIVEGSRCENTCGDAGAGIYVIARSMLSQNVKKISFSGVLAAA